MKPTFAKLIYTKVQLLWHLSGFTSNGGRTSGVEDFSIGCHAQMFWRLLKNKHFDVPSWELTYPLLTHFEDGFPFPQVGHGSSLEGMNILEDFGF